MNVSYCLCNESIFDKLSREYILWSLFCCCVIWWSLWCSMGSFSLSRCVFLFVFIIAGFGECSLVLQCKWINYRVVWWLNPHDVIMMKKMNLSLFYSITTWWHSQNIHISSSALLWTQKFVYTPSALLLSHICFFYHLIFIVSQFAKEYWLNPFSHATRLVH